MKIISIICVALFITTIIVSFISLMRKFVLFIVEAITGKDCELDIIIETILIAANVFSICVYYYLLY